jgi:transglutaminase-like putative cysteine protease
MQETMIGQEYRAPGRFVDSDSPRVIEFARAASAGATEATDAMLRLYSAVRDEILYDAYVDWTDPNAFRASSVLAAKRGFCVGKACLLAACARVLGVPSRLGFADVRNHMTSPRLYERMKTDVFRWHAYCELQLSGKWVKATPAFNASLCERLGVKPLEFDGWTDSLFQPFDNAGRKHMEYVVDRGTFADVPFETILADFRAHYAALSAEDRLAGDFQSEAVAASQGAINEVAGSTDRYEF